MLKDCIFLLKSAIFFFKGSSLGSTIIQPVLDVLDELMGCLFVGVFSGDHLGNFSGGISGRISGIIDGGISGIISGIMSGRISGGISGDNFRETSSRLISTRGVGISQKLQSLPGMVCHAVAEARYM